MDNPGRIALAVIALSTVQAIVLLIVVAAGGSSSWADHETRAMIQASYATAGGDP